MCDSGPAYTPSEDEKRKFNEAHAKDPDSMAPYLEYSKDAEVVQAAVPLPPLPPPAPTLTDLISKWSVEYGLEQKPQAGSRQSQFTSGPEGDTTMPLLGGATKTKLGGG